MCIQLLAAGYLSMYELLLRQGINRLIRQQQLNNNLLWLGLAFQFLAKSVL